MNLAHRKCRCCFKTQSKRKFKRHSLVCQTCKRLEESKIVSSKSSLQIEFLGCISKRIGRITYQSFKFRNYEKVFALPTVLAITVAQHGQERTQAVCLGLATSVWNDLSADQAVLSVFWLKRLPTTEPRLFCNQSVPDPFDPMTERYAMESLACNVSALSVDYRVVVPRISFVHASAHDSGDGEVRRQCVAVLSKTCLLYTSPSPRDRG